MRPTLRCLFCRGLVLKEEGLARYKDHLAQEHNIEHFIDWVVDKTLLENDNHKSSQLGEASIIISKCEDDNKENELSFGELDLHIKENEQSFGELNLKDDNLLTVHDDNDDADVKLLTAPSPRDRVVCGARSPLSSVRRNKLSPSAKKVNIGGKKLTFNVDGSVGSEHLLEAKQKMKKTRSKRMSIIAFQTNYKRPVAVPTNSRRMSIMSPRGKIKSSRERKCSFEECGATFESMIELRKHKANHPKKTFKCDECDEEFDYKNFLEKHKRICQLP